MANESSTVEQLTYLLFLKMADEQTKPHFNKPSTIPAGLDRQSLLSKEGDALEIQDPAMLANPPFGKKSSYTIVNGEGKAKIHV